MDTGQRDSQSTTTQTSSFEGSFNSAYGDVSPEVIVLKPNTTESTSKEANIKNGRRENGSNGNGNGNGTNGTNLLYAINKNAAEGLMDIALLSANANQLRFLLTYNHKASTFYISLTLVAISLILQVLVGIGLIFKHRFQRCRNKRYNELVIGGVFIITVVNILLAAFTTTTGDYN